MIIDYKDGYREEIKGPVANVPKILNEHLNDRLAGLPKVVKDRIRASLTFLKDKDFEGLDMNYFIDGILEDYCDGVAVK